MSVTHSHCAALLPPAVDEQVALRIVRQQRCSLAIHTTEGAIPPRCNGIAIIKHVTRAKSRAEYRLRRKKVINDPATAQLVRCEM